MILLTCSSALFSAVFGHLDERGPSVTPDLEGGRLEEMGKAVWSLSAWTHAAAQGEQRQKASMMSQSSEMWVRVNQQHPLEGGNSLQMSIQLDVVTFTRDQLIWKKPLPPTVSSSSPLKPKEIPELLRSPCRLSASMSDHRDIKFQNTFRSQNILQR